jgi:hypothetical protein
MFSMERSKEKTMSEYISDSGFTSLGDKSWTFECISSAPKAWKEAFKIYQQLLRGEYELALKTLPRHEYMKPVFDEDLKRIRAILNLHVKPGVSEEYADAIDNSSASV